METCPAQMQQGPSAGPADECTPSMRAAAEAAAGNESKKSRRKATERPTVGLAASCRSGPELGPR
jgi:hypothetical protein